MALFQIIKKYKDIVLYLFGECVQQWSMVLFAYITNRK